MEHIRDFFDSQADDAMTTDDLDHIQRILNDIGRDVFKVRNSTVLINDNHRHRLESNLHVLYGLKEGNHHREFQEGKLINKRINDLIKQIKALLAIQNQLVKSDEESKETGDRSDKINQNDKDHAMNPQASTKEDHVQLVRKGGIDLNPAQMSVQVNKEGNDFNFNLNGISIDAAQITGVSFIIRQISPVTNLPQILGLTL